MNTKTTLLIVDDEPDIRSLIQRYFSRTGMQVITASCGAEMEQALKKYPVDILLLDVCLPDGSGIDLLGKIRSIYNAGIIMLTAQSATEQRIDGLNRGADDYLPKPFDLAELHARINAVLRRRESTLQQKIETRRYHFEHYILDTQTRTLSDVSGQEIKLTPAEYDLLLVMVSNPNTVLDRDYLMLTTRGRPASAHDRAIDVRMGQLRKKLPAEKPDKTLFSTIRGGGYMLNSKVSEH